MIGAARAGGGRRGGGLAGSPVSRQDHRYCGEAGLMISEGVFRVQRVFSVGGGGRSLHRLPWVSGLGVRLLRGRCGGRGR